MFLDFPKVNKAIQNTLCIIICSYISCVWYNREETQLEVCRFKAKIIKVQKAHMMMYKEKAKVLFSENYCNMRVEILNNL